MSPSPPPTNPDLREHRISVRVRYAETDAMGYLHHSVYAVYFEMGRTELLRAQGGDYRIMESRGLYFVLAKLEVRFHRPARYDDELELTTRITRQSGAKLIHEYELHRGDELITTGSTTLACVDADGQVQRIPPLSIMQPDADTSTMGEEP